MTADAFTEEKNNKEKIYIMMHIYMNTFEIQYLSTTLKIILMNDFFADYSWISVEFNDDIKKI